MKTAKLADDILKVKEKPKRKLKQNEIFEISKKSNTPKGAKDSNSNKKKIIHKQSSQKNPKPLKRNIIKDMVKRLMPLTLKQRLPDNLESA